jgi:hypothetical protein
MPAVIEFDYDPDRLRAIEALDETDETYECIPDRRFLVSSTAVAMLQSRGIRFRTIGERPREEPNHGTRP